MANIGPQAMPPPSTITSEVASGDELEGELNHKEGQLPQEVFLSGVTAETGVVGVSGKYIY